LKNVRRFYKFNFCVFDFLISIYLKFSFMELLVNDKKYRVDAFPAESLLTVLRERLDLTGSKYGCGEGSCGACTVLLDGTAVRSCTLPASSAAGKAITTIEGLRKNGSLHRVQQAFLKVDVFQCAYCAPGMLLSAVSLLEKNPKPTRQQITQAMQGNVCRCGTYPRVVKAIEEASTV
jgi:aerobic-type carbon monoxide dehydrogenase small subunit (CoxS/CutS family)